MPFLLRLLVALLLLAPLRAAADLPEHPQHAGNDATYGVHGMLLFGGSDGLFASHLPLFSPPHDRRVLLRIAIADPELDSAIRSRLRAQPALWTIEPEGFALSRLLPQASDPLRTFRATLVEGHFERGGRPVYKNVLIKVVEVVENTPIAPPPVAPAMLTYNVLGQGQTWFLVKTVDARPDFDHVVAFPPGDSPRLRTITLPRHGVEPPSLAALGKPFDASGLATVYFETNDLR